MGMLIATAMPPSKIAINSCVNIFELMICPNEYCNLKNQKNKVNCPPKMLNKWYWLKLLISLYPRAYQTEIIDADLN